jgi:pimeloyl-ACP methyl ester carboxylesterase
MARQKLGDRKFLIPALLIGILLAGQLHCHTAFAETDTNLRAGLNELNFKDGQLYYLYVPPKVLKIPEGAKILVAVHGYNGQKADEKGRRNVRRTAERWSKSAQIEGWVVLAPHFDETRFNRRYQTMNTRGLRADARLHQLVEETEKMLSGIKTDKLLLFGFSGGGQFVHRYAAFNPERVDRAVAGAPGWYTWPDPWRSYPVGTGSKYLPKGLKPKMCKLCGLDLLVIVGDKDLNAGAFAEKYGDHNLLELQGEGRVHRARNWVDAMREYAAEHDCPYNITLEIVPFTGHKINTKLLNTSTDFLSGD